MLGGGGAGKSIYKGLLSSGYQAVNCRRTNGELLELVHGDVLISTWPAEYQSKLEQKLEESQSRFSLVIDAQFFVPEGPLERWCSRHGFQYIAGQEWWKFQAREQDKIWFGEDRLGMGKQKITALVPESKSEMIRAMIVAVAFGLETEIRNPSHCEDTEVLAKALQLLGVKIEQQKDSWRISPPAKLIPPDEVIYLGEGATGFRLFCALASVMGGDSLLIDIAPSLRSRPLEVPAASWPMRLKTGAAIPSIAPMDKTSQFASGILIMGAAKVFRGELPEYSLKIEGERVSQPYLDLTMKILRETGLQVVNRGNAILVSKAKSIQHWVFLVAKDASALSFLEVLAKFWDLTPFLREANRQGDSIFPVLLDQWLRAGTVVNLRNYPDLAPCFWAAAVLFRKNLCIVDTPQLRWKESDRAKTLLDATLVIGGKGVLTDDGIKVDFEGWVPPGSKRILITAGDHRMAMAFGIVQTEYANICPDNLDCVKKSFPAFWPCLAAWERCLPG